MQISFADIFYVVVKWRRLIVTLFILFTLVAIAIAFLLPIKFTSVSTILPPEETAGADLGFLSMLTDLPVNIPSLPGMVSPADQYIAILRSRNVQEAVIAKLNLMEHFKTKYMTDALKKLNTICFFDKTEENLIVIMATERTPQLAQKIVQTFVDELDRVNQETRQTSARYSREFLEKRLQEVEVQFHQAAENIRQFQIAHKSIALEEQVKAVIEAAAQLRSEIALKEVELHLLEKSMESTHPTVIQAKFQLQELHKQLNKLETGAGLNSSEYIVPFSKVPDLGMQYAFLTRDVEVYKAVYTLLIQQYEQAKLQEKKDTPTLKLLDRPNLPDKKSKPQRRLIVMVGALLSILVSFFIVFFIEYLRNLQLSDHNRYEKIIGAWRTLNSDFKLRRVK